MHLKICISHFIFSCLRSQNLNSVSGKKTLHISRALMSEWKDKERKKERKKEKKKERKMRERERERERESERKKR